MSSSSEILRKEMATTWQFRIDVDPELAASLGLLSERVSTHAIDPRSLQSFQDRFEWVQRALKRLLENVKRGELADDNERLSYDLYLQELSDYVNYTPRFRTFLCCVNRLEGPQTDLLLYARYIPVQKSRVFREFYRDFLRAIPTQLAEVQTLLQTGLEEKRTPPQISLQGVVEQIRGMVAEKLSVFRGPLEHLEDDLRVECEALLDGLVVEAWTQFATFLESEYIPNLRTEISAIQGYPDGEDYYRACLQFHTTTEMTAQEIHNLGLQEVDRINQAMKDIAKEAGYDDLSSYLEYLRTSPEFEPESGPALVSLFRDITGRIAPALLKVFHWKTLPRMPFEILETPATSAPTAPAAYYLAGSTNPSAPRPGMFYCNTSELKTRRTYECEALALHEAIPGHHTQAAIQSEHEDMPEFRKYMEDRRYFEAPCRFPFYTGYVEGWGLHSETLGAELGLYEKPEMRFGQLSMEALRSCRLVVDTGMHALGWSREQAVDFMLENTAMGAYDAANEVARYITWPGQATAYKVGERFFHRLRQKAETALGDTFDPRDFYDVVLPCGPVPLQILERLVDEYIAGEKTVVPKVGANDDFLDQMTFATTWCKCCVVPGACGSTLST